MFRYFTLVLTIIVAQSCKAHIIEIPTNSDIRVKSIADFGAKLDGVSDDSAAIQASLETLNYAFIPISEKGALIRKEITLKNGQKIYGISRASKIISEVPKGKAAIKIDKIPFSGSAVIEDLSIIVNTSSIGIHILESRGAFVENIFIHGQRKCTKGIFIDGGESLGSAWNQIDKYTILRCNIGIELSSSTKINWCNRNLVAFGVVQSCNIAVKLEKADTNKVEANPQDSGIGFLIVNSHHNRFESFAENSSEYDIHIDRPSRQNTFVGEFSPSRIEDKGYDNDFMLSRKRIRMYYDRVGNKN